jgi:2-polyprenyl-3-methyl-5-hydroxy-6-metoxy-1,4-benzoquinol methylase
MKSGARCPACKSSSSRLMAQRGCAISLRSCLRCGLVFHNEFSSEAEVGEYYGHYYHDSNLSFSPITESRFKALLSSFEPYRKSGRVLDVGCGAGHFLKIAMEQGWAAYGTEVADGAFEQLSRLGINYFRGELRSASFPGQFFDVIYCSEVIEHLLDPAALLAESFNILRPGGILYLTTPNYDSLSRRLIGPDWRVICKEHICYFTPKVLRRALTRAGFKAVKIKTRNIDPNELRKVFGKRSATAGEGFQAEATERLRQSLETSRALGLAKGSVNMLLSLASAGDSIIARAER